MERQSGCRQQKKDENRTGIDQEGSGPTAQPLNHRPLILIYKCVAFVSPAQVNPFVLPDSPLITLKLSLSINAPIWSYS